MNVLRISERKYYQDELDHNKNNLNKSWKIINNIIGRQKQKSNKDSKFNHNNKTISGDSEIAQHFNDFFINIGPTLASKIPQSTTDPLSIMSGNYMESFFFTPTTELEILDIIRNLKNSSAGWDDISSRVIKYLANELNKPLNVLCNLSLTSGI